MEEQTENWTKDYVIVFEGRFYKVRNKKGGDYLPNSFTNRKRAEEFITALHNQQITTKFNKAVKKIKNSDKTVKQKMREYKKICQQMPELS